MNAIHPHIMVEEVEKHISLMFAPFNQPLGMQFQHPVLLNNTLLNKVPPYTMPNILYAAQLEFDRGPSISHL